MIKLSFLKKHAEYDDEQGIALCKYYVVCRNTQTRQVYFDAWVSGTSKKSPYDVGSIVRGMRIAEARAKYAAYKMARAYFRESVRQILERRKNDDDVLAFYQLMNSYKQDEQKSISRATDAFIPLLWLVDDDYND